MDQFSASLIVPTRSRPDHLAPRLPYWTAAGFAEVIVVDGSFDGATRRVIEAVCKQAGARYVGAPPSLWDTRSMQRNLGARMARGSWILFQDDDDDAVLGINRNALGAAAQGKDWLAGPIGEHIVWHRREAFLAFGGYPEDMVAAEDWIMSNRARGHGPGGLEPAWHTGSKSFPPPREDPIGRIRNSFWYGYTLLVFLLRCPKRHEVIVGDSRRIAILAMSALKRPHRFAFVAIGLFGRSISVFHCLRVAARSGFNALRKEEYHGWQGLREERLRSVETAS